MINIEKAANGWIMRGRINNQPVTMVATSREEVVKLMTGFDL